MKHLISLAAISCSIPVIEAGSFKWNVNNARDVGSHLAAQETGDLLMQLQPAGPAPTSPPDLKRPRAQVLGNRAAGDTVVVPGSVCGYMSHDFESTLACAVDNTCLFTTYGTEWVAGCCPTTSTGCPVVTTCVDYSVGASLASIDFDATYWCATSSYPKCVTLSYADVPGYTIYNCGGPQVITSQTIDHSLNSDDLGSTSSTSTSRSSASSEDDDTPTSASANRVSSTTSTASPTNSTASAAPAPKSPTPIGAIVGGAVGGIAVIAILILGLVFILRRSRRNNNPGPPMAQSHTAQPPPPPPQQQAPMNAPATYAPPPQQPPMHTPPPGMQQSGFPDNRASIQKHPYDINTQSVYAPTLSTPGSPPPPQSPNLGAAPPGYVASQGGHGGPNNPSPGPDATAFPPQQNGSSNPAYQSNNAAQHHYNAAYHEMSAGRGDGELRELA